MSQKILNQGWEEVFVSTWTDKKHAMKLAKRLRSRVQHAMDLLDETPVGTEVVFEGHCPSGSTYTGYTMWDGTEQCREEIAKKAYRNADAVMRESEKVKRGMFQADMRTGRL